MQERVIPLGILNKSVMPLALVMRFAAYTLAIYFFSASLPLLVQNGDVALFRENGPIEWVQFGLLIGASSVFIAGSSVIFIFREILLLLASVSAFAAVRELDGLLDQVIPWVGWKIGFAIVLYAAGLAYAKRSKLKWQIEQFLSSPAFAVLWAGFIVAVPFAQLLGHGPLLEALMGDNYERAYKRVIEEVGELVGYFLLMAGSVETMVHMKAAQFRKLAQLEKMMAAQQSDRPGFQAEPWES